MVEKRHRYKGGWIQHDEITDFWGIVLLAAYLLFRSIGGDVRVYRQERQCGLFRPAASRREREGKEAEGRRSLLVEKKSEADYSSSIGEEKRSTDYSRVTVVMYMTDWCGYCKQARQYIRSLGADLIEHNIDKDKSKKDEMKKKSGGTLSVPLIDIDGTIIRGYSQSAIKVALDRSAAR
jgi:glutaredoxin